METNETTKARWCDDTAKRLKGRRIVDVRYMTPGEQADAGFHKACIVLVLDDGHAIYPARDNMGNDAGALFTTFEDLHVVPTI